ncbi:MAG TPA: VOC family protein [Polyangiales bacterium]|nr:VOC family protein [Polyangiales bacterium]
MKPTPDGWPRISASIFYDDPKRAIEWLCKVFGFEVRLIVETGEGAIAHSELVYGEGLIMVGDAHKQEFWRSPRTAGGNTQSLMVIVDDVEAHCARSKSHGVELFQELKISDYGEEYWKDRSYGAVDCEGHRWWFMQRLATGNTEWSKVRNKHDRHG